MGNKRTFFKGKGGAMFVLSHPFNLDSLHSGLRGREHALLELGVIPATVSFYNSEMSLPQRRRKEFY